MTCYRDCYVILSLGIAAACSNHGCLIMKQARACMVMVIQQISWERICHSVEYSYGRRVTSQVAQARNISIGEHHHCCVTFEIWGFVWEKKPIVSVTYENERISIKNSIPYLKCVFRLSCVVHRPIYGRFMGFYVNGSLSLRLRYPLYIERKPFT